MKLGLHFNWGKNWKPRYNRVYIGVIVGNHRGNLLVYRDVPFGTQRLCRDSRGFSAHKRMLSEVCWPTTSVAFQHEWVLGLRLGGFRSSGLRIRRVEG